MKGVVLAGGLGTRLYPLTKVLNKHLLPIGRKPMIYYPIELLVGAGITDITIVTGGPNAGDFMRLLGHGKQFGLDYLNFVYQEGEGGIAEALGLTRAFVGDDRLVVVLGDNWISGSLKPFVEKFRLQPSGARLLLKEMPDPRGFGVAEFQDGRLVRIEEKPEHPKSHYVVTGVYMYDCRVFDIINTLRPSERGELEITDVNNRYIAWGEVEFDVLDSDWTDAGTFYSLVRANLMAMPSEERARLIRDVQMANDP